MQAVPADERSPTGLRQSRAPELDGLRGLAILGVVAGHLFERLTRFDHAGSASTGFDAVAGAVSPYAGCCLFFVLSGYSLFRHMDPDLQRHTDRNAPGGGRVMPFGYIRRRILTLWPPYAVVLVLTYALLLLTAYRPQGTTRFFVAPGSLTDSLAASLVFLHGLIYGTAPRLFPPGWFLEVQFQFYCAGPLILTGYLRLVPRQARLPAAVGLLAVFAGLSLIADRDGWPRLHGSVVSFLAYYWLGIVLAEHGRTVRSWLDAVLPPTRRGARTALGWGAVIMLVTAEQLGRFDAVRLLTQLLCLAIILSVAFDAVGGLRRVLVTPALRMTGRACYAVYLVHLQVLQLILPALVAALAGLTAAWQLLGCGILATCAVMIAGAAFYLASERLARAFAIHRLGEAPAAQAGE